MLPPFDLGVLGTDPETQKVLPKASLLGPQTAFWSVIASAKMTLLGEPPTPTPMVLTQC